VKSLLAKHRPSPALVIACIALFAAIGGTAFGLPGKNKIDKNDLRKAVVGAKQLKKNAVTNPKIKAGAVTGDKLGAGSIGGAQLGAGAVSAAKLGATVVHTGESVVSSDNDTNTGNVVTGSATATCDAGETLISGGAKWSAGNAANKNIYISESYPDGNSWKATGIYDAGAQSNATLQAIAICLK